MSQLPHNASIALRNGMNLAMHKIESGEFTEAADMLGKAVKTLRGLARRQASGTLKRRPTAEQIVWGQR